MIGKNGESNAIAYTLDSPFTEHQFRLLSLVKRKSVSLLRFVSRASLHLICHHLCTYIVDKSQGVRLQKKFLWRKTVQLQVA